MRHPESEPQTESRHEESRGRSEGHGQRAHVRVERRARRCHRGSQRHVRQRHVTIADRHPERRKHCALGTPTQAHQTVTGKIVGRAADEVHGLAGREVREYEVIVLSFHDHRWRPVIA